MSIDSGCVNALPLVMQKIFELFSVAMQSRFVKACDNLEPQLLNEARCSSDMAIKEACIIAIEIIADNRQEMQDCFMDLLTKDFCSFKVSADDQKTRKTVAVADMDLSHLSLVDEDTLQERIDIQSMVANTQRGCEYLLVPIANGIAKTCNVDQIEPYDHPLAPSRIGEWLQTTLHKGDYHSIARHAIYQTFKEELFDTLAPLYKDVIDIFQEHSIELAIQKSKSSSYNIKTLTSHPVDLGFVSPDPLSTAGHRRGLDQQVESISDEAFTSDNDGIPQLSEEVPIKPKTDLLNINDWLKENKVPQTIQFEDGFESAIDESYGLSDIQEGDDRTLISVSARQLDQVLSEIQQEMLRDETDWVAKLRQYLLSRTNEHELCVINPLHENIMRLVNHALNLICQVFHPSVARYLNSLRVSFVRFAIADKAYLNNSMHPAKSLFDGLTHLCYGLNPSEKRIIRQLFRTVRSFYEVGGGEGPGLEKLQYDLLVFVNAEQQRTLETEQETLKALLSQKQRYLAFKTADAFIETRFKTLPKVLTFHELLHVALRHILAESYLGGGSGSEDWRLTTKIFNSLVSTSQARSTEDNKHKILSAMPKLLNKLGEFFRKHSISLDVQSLIVKQTGEIQSLIVKGRDGASLTDEELSETKTIRYLLNKIQDETKESYRQKQIIGIDHDCPAPFRASDEVALPETGQRLAYYVDNNLLMCKYVFHFAPLDKLVFVNWEGEKLFEREQQLVKEDLTKGYAKTMELPVPLESAFRYVVKQSDGRC